MKKLLGGAGAALGVKIVTGLAVAALAATAAVAATEVAVTGSINPANWGQQVKEQVADCKEAALAAGRHGIGECVSDFAKKHGDAVSDTHQNGGADKDSDHNANGKDKKKRNGHSSDKSQTSRPETTSTTVQNIGPRR